MGEEEEEEEEEDDDDDDDDDVYTSNLGRKWRHEQQKCESLGAL